MKRSAKTTRAGGNNAMPPFHPVLQVFRLVPLLPLLAAALCLGCSGQSAKHLPHARWESAVPQTVLMRHLLFRYRVAPAGDEIDVAAEAYPQPDRLPDWASWYGEIGLDIYITDENGTVLARQGAVLPPRPLDPQAGLPVQARFNLGTNVRQPLFVAFGYRLILADAAPDRAVRKILAAEGALER